VLYAVAGDGTGNATEIKATLADLHEKAKKDEAEFWFVLIAKDEPSKTDTAIIKWCVDNDIYFETVGEGVEGAQVEHDPGDDAYAALLEVMEANKDDGVVCLALFINNDEDIEEDGALYTMVEQAIEAEVEVRLLNGQMVRLQLSTEDAEPEEAPEEAPEDEPEATQQQGFSEADLKKMTPTELAAIAKGQGVNLQEVGRAKGALIAAILGAAAGSAPAPAAAPTLTGVSTNGAMLVVLVDGGVHIKPISAEEARTMV
jgi:hypothetical protein